MTKPFEVPEASGKSSSPQQGNANDGCPDAGAAAGCSQGEGQSSGSREYQEQELLQSNFFSNGHPSPLWLPIPEPMDLDVDESSVRPSSQEVTNSVSASRSQMVEREMQNGREVPFVPEDFIHSGYIEIYEQTRFRILLVFIRGTLEPCVVMSHNFSNFFLPLDIFRKILFQLQCIKITLSEEQEYEPMQVDESDLFIDVVTDNAVVILYKDNKIILSNCEWTALLMNEKLASSLARAGDGA